MAIPTAPARARLLTPTVIVAALGYFVDIYDLILFSIVRVPSLKSLGYEGEGLLSAGVLLLNLQLVGMVLGGLFWGILADKRGRLSVLYASIIMYSIANLANGFVDSLWWYGFWRFWAGIGLAGELGVGITLVAETVDKERRGLATTIVACVGLAGAVFSGLSAELVSWRTSYIIGGGLGLSLLALRVGVAESGMFAHLQGKHVDQGNFLSIFRKPGMAFRYLCSIAMGVPAWFQIGILLTFASEFAAHFGVVGRVSPGIIVACCYGGSVFGDMILGLLSQHYRTRTRVLLGSLLLQAVVIAVFLAFVRGVSPATLYGWYFLIGISGGYWVLFITIATEQFGTNIRGTVTTTVPNFVRGMAVPITLGFAALKPTLGLVGSASALGAICFALAIGACLSVPDTFGKDLDYVE